MNSLSIQVRWMCLECCPNEAYKFPSPRNAHIRKWYSRPGIYRWAVFDMQGRLCEAYVGETESIFSRLGQYLRPGKTQQTNLRLNAHVRDLLIQGLRLEYQVMEFDPFQINDVIINDESLGDPYVRRLIEALAISELRLSKCRILNLGQDALDKGIRRAIAPLNLPEAANGMAVSAVRELFRKKAAYDAMEPKKLRRQTKRASFWEG